MKWDEHQREIAKKIDRWERHVIYMAGIIAGEQSVEQEAQAEVWEIAFEKGFEKGWEIGFEKGWKEGKRINQKEIVLRLDGMGYEPEEIVKLSGVSLEDVQKILNGEDLNSDQ